MNGRFGPSRAPPPIRTNSRWMDRFWTGGGGRWCGRSAPSACWSTPTFKLSTPTSKPLRWSSPTPTLAPVDPGD